MDDQLAALRTADRSLFPTSFTIRALRDSRYHNTAYAIAELIDNSIEAHAGNIDLLCAEEYTQVGTRRRRRVCRIAVLDDGVGMDVETLLEALKFGGGTRHHSPKGIGKYGMGLPTSSMSQCKRVDVWTWKDGIDSAWHSTIDADEIASGNHQVPVPDQTTPIPTFWTDSATPAVLRSPTGTLVVWSRLDKIQWKTAKAIVENTSREVGRIHRKWLDEGFTTIRAACFLEAQPVQRSLEAVVVANDPLYLMRSTSTPEPWDSEPMFQEWGNPKYFSRDINGKQETIEVRYSIVRPEALKTDLLTQNPGSTPRGRHARHNIGVSVVREEREIVLEDAFLREGGSADNPQNRWWGCEVSFGRNCDELFGVDHNKQMVANFTQAAKMFSHDDRTREKILDEMGIEPDLLHEIVGEIRDQTRAMMRAIRQMFAQRRPSPVIPSNGKTSEETAARTATDADRQALVAGEEKKTQTDIDRERIPQTERQAELTRQFKALGQAENDARELARRLVEEDLSYQFNSCQLDGFQMFNIRSNQGILHINLNTDHPIYNLLRHLEKRLDDGVDASDPTFLATVTMRLLLSSWARMEDQTESTSERRNIQHIATTWGRQVDKVISQLREKD